MHAAVSHLTSSIGESILVYDWPPASASAPRAAVLLLHSLSSHSLRHQELVAYLLRSGFWVRAYDQTGNGASEGLRGHLMNRQQTLEDASDVIDNWRLEIGRNLPLLLVGLGSGAVLAADLAQNVRADIAGLVLIAPVFAESVPSSRRWLQRYTPFLYRRLQMAYRIERLLSRTPLVQRAYRSDPLVHHKITANTAQWLAGTGAKLLQQAGQWRTPTLLLYAGADAVADTAATQAFLAAANAQLLHECYPEMYHEILHEPGKEQVCARLKGWLTRQFPPAGQA